MSKSEFSWRDFIYDKFYKIILVLFLFLCFIGYIIEMTRHDEINILDIIFLPIFPISIFILINKLYKEFEKTKNNL